MSSHRDVVVLVPGFFGFANLGDIAYFAHVKDFLAENGPRLGLDAEVRLARTYPTASLRRRAASLLESVAEISPPDSDANIHLVGHSSGGLDVRLFVTPGASLAHTLELEPYARRVKTVVTVSTPHLGTPLASFFSSVIGAQVLRLLSLATIYGLRTGRLPIRVLAQLVRFLVAPQRILFLTKPQTVIDQLYEQLLGDFTADRRIAIETFFHNVGAEQDLIPQLTPSAMDVFNAATFDRPGVRYGCVVTRTRPPSLGSFARAGLNPYGQTTHALYLALYRLAATMPRVRGAAIDGQQANALVRALGALPDWHANDGIVPTLSQVWGHVIQATWGDHLDVIGHFHHPTHVPPHFDWLQSSSGFTRRDFETTWNHVIKFLAGQTVEPEPFPLRSGKRRDRLGRRRGRTRRR